MLSISDNITGTQSGNAYYYFHIDIYNNLFLKICTPNYTIDKTFFLYFYYNHKSLLKVNIM